MMECGIKSETRCRKAIAIPSDFMNPPETPYTKTEINRMSTADLKKLASENGIENATEINGGDLKKMLIEKFGL